jgi:hypothetical protein
MLQHRQAETPAPAPPCASCGGAGSITSYFVVVHGCGEADRDETTISKREFDRLMEAELKAARGVRISIPLKRVRTCPKCRPAVNRDRRNYGS